MHTGNVQADFGRDILNRRVVVFWEGDGMSYSGTIQDYSATSDTHYIVYDDGELTRTPTGTLTGVLAGDLT